MDRFTWSREILSLALFEIAADVVSAFADLFGSSK
jgi:hypothetical protein